jgi:divalent metal cation (Fe/Co/Zn/Cd) transporter
MAVTTSCACIPTSPFRSSSRQASPSAAASSKGNSPARAEEAAAPEASPKGQSPAQSADVEEVVGPSSVEVDICTQQLPTLMTSRKQDPQQDIQKVKAEAVNMAQLDIVNICVGGDASPQSNGANSEAEREMRRVRQTKLVSYVSLVASVIVGSAGLGLGIANSTLSLVGLGLEAALDGLSSALVIWRFKTGKPRQHEDEEVAARFKARRDAKRERNSGFGIGGTFIALSFILMCSAGYKLAAWAPGSSAHHQVQGANWTVILSLPSALIFGTLAVAKFRLAFKLQSQVLEKDALCSLLGAALALICSVAGLLEGAVEDPANIAAVDAVAGAIIALILLVEGSRTLHHNLWPAGEEKVSEAEATALPQP